MDPNVKITRVNKVLPLPKRHSTNAACFDAFCSEDVTLEPDELAVINLGIKLEMPIDLCCMVLGRSGTLKRGLIVYSTRVDADYRGTVFCFVTNKTKVPICI